MNKIIRFSYPFSKLFHNSALLDEARLLQVVRIKLEDLTQEMRDYDTDFGKFPLPQKGDYIMLIFQNRYTGGLFTTIRRETPSKLEYYQGAVGEWFDLDISNDAKTEEI